MKRSTFHPKLYKSIYCRTTFQVVDDTIKVKKTISTKRAGCSFYTYPYYKHPACSFEIFCKLVAYITGNFFRTYGAARWGNSFTRVE